MRAARSARPIAVTRGSSGRRRARRRSRPRLPRASCAASRARTAAVPPDPRLPVEDAAPRRRRDEQRREREHRSSSEEQRRRDAATSNARLAKAAAPSSGRTRASSSGRSPTIRKRSRPIIVSNGDGQTSRSAAKPSGIFSGSRSRHDGRLRRQDDLVDPLAPRRSRPDRRREPSDGRPWRSLRRSPTTPTSSTPVQGWRRIVSATSAAAGPPPTIMARRRGCGKRRSSAVRQTASSAPFDDDVDDEDRPREASRAGPGSRPRRASAARRRGPGAEAARAAPGSARGPGRGRRTRARRPGRPPRCSDVPGREAHARRRQERQRCPGSRRGCAGRSAASRAPTAIATIADEAPPPGTRTRRPRRHQERAVRVQNGRL